MKNRLLAAPFLSSPLPHMKTPTKKLPREFYTRANVLTVARELLGKLLVVPTIDGTRVSGMIVETEAYRGPLDRASHAYGGRRTKRTETMYGLGGTVYIFFVYGMYNQFNVVTNVEDVPHAVLVRALQPAEGIELMRSTSSGPTGSQSHQRTGQALHRNGNRPQTRSCRLVRKPGLARSR